MFCEYCGKEIIEHPGNMGMDYSMMYVIEKQETPMPYYFVDILGDDDVPLCECDRGESLMWP